MLKTVIPKKPLYTHPINKRKTLPWRKIVVVSKALLFGTETIHELKVDMAIKAANDNINLGSYNGVVQVSFYLLHWQL